MWAHIHRAVYFGLDRQGQMVIPGLSMFHVLFTLLHLLHNQGRTLRTSASMFYWCTVPACLCALDLSEGADITAPPFVSFCLARCCSEARNAERDGWEHITPPLAMCVLLASHPSHLSWSICLCRVNYGSLDQSNCCLEQLWQDEWEGSQGVKKQGWILTNKGKSNASNMDAAPRKHEILKHGCFTHILILGPRSTHQRWYDVIVLQLNLLHLCFQSSPKTEQTSSKSLSSTNIWVLRTWEAQNTLFKRDTVFIRE